MIKGTRKNEVEYDDQDKKILEVFQNLKNRYGLEDDLQIHNKIDGDSKVSIYRIGRYIFQKSLMCDECSMEKRAICRAYDIHEVFYVGQARDGVDTSYVEEIGLKPMGYDSEEVSKLDPDVPLVYVVHVSTMDSWIDALCGIVSLLVMQQLKEFSRGGEFFSEENERKIRESGVCSTMANRTVN